MSGQDRKVRIIADLKVLSILSRGQTLSPSTMTPVYHDSWSTSLFRARAGEDRTKTIAHIKGIFTEALSILSIDCDQDILNHMEPALKGFAVLKDTYRRDYYTMAEIDRIIDSVRCRLNDILDQKEPQTEDSDPSNFRGTISQIKSIFDQALSLMQSDASSQVIDQIESSFQGLEALKHTYKDNPGLTVEIDELINATRMRMEDIVSRQKKRLIQTCEDEFVEDHSILDAMNSNSTTQKILSSEDTETTHSAESQSTSHTETVVSLSDRTSHQESIHDTTDVNDTISPSEHSSVLLDFSFNVVNSQAVGQDPNVKKGLERQPVDKVYKSDWDDTERVKDLVKSAADNIAKPVVNASERTTDFGIADSGLSKSPIHTQRTEVPSTITLNPDTVLIDMLRPVSVLACMNETDNSPSSRLDLAESSSGDSDTNASKEFLKNIFPCAEQHPNYSGCCSEPHSITSPDTSGATSDTTPIAYILEFDLEAQEWRPVPSVADSARVQSANFASGDGDGSGYESAEDTNSTYTTEHSIYSGEESRNIQEASQSPPIIKLAKAFKQWVDSTKSGVDSDNSDSQSNESNSDSNDD